MLARFVNRLGFLVLRLSDYWMPKLARFGWDLALWRQREPVVSESIINYFQSQGLEVMSLEEFNRAYPVGSTEPKAPWDTLPPNPWEKN